MIFLKTLIDSQPFSFFYEMANKSNVYNFKHLQLIGCHLLYERGKINEKKTRFCSRIGLTLSSFHTFCTYSCCYSYGSNLNLYFSFVDCVGSAFSTIIDPTLYVKFMTNTFSSNTISLPLVIVLLIRIYFSKDCLIIKGT